MKKYILQSLVIVSIVSMLSGCKADAEEDNIIKIGLLMDSLVIERWQRDRDMFVASAKEKGAEVIIQNANENNEKQAQQIVQLINEGVDVLVIVPYDMDGLKEVIDEAHKKGIKVIAYDRLIMDSEIDVYVSFDNVMVGTLMGEAITEAVPSGNYVIINGSSYDHNSYMFNEGYKNVIEPYIETGQINIIAEKWADDWREEVAYDTLETLLRQGRKIDAVICANDRLAESAIRILSEYRLAGEVKVVGHDADLVACQQIVEGTQLLTVYKPIQQLSAEAVDTAIKLAKGEKLNYSETINNGRKDVPYIMIEPVPVTKDNINDTVIADGFHSIEDVYRNVPKSQWPNDNDNLIK